MNAIELLTIDDTGHAVPGPQYPADRGDVVYWLPDDEDVSARRLAYRHHFYRIDTTGQPMRDTIVAFYVPDYLCDATPQAAAFRAVVERMGRHTGV